MQLTFILCFLFVQLLTATVVLTVVFVEYCTGNADWSSAKGEAFLDDKESSWWWQIRYAGLWESYASCFAVSFLPCLIIEMAVSFQALKSLEVTVSICCVCIKMWFVIKICDKICDKNVHGLCPLISNGVTSPMVSRLSTLACCRVFWHTNFMLHLLKMDSLLIPGYYDL